MRKAKEELLEFNSTRISISVAHSNRVGLSFYSFHSCHSPIRFHLSPVASFGEEGSLIGSSGNYA
jgi:hypothetical protein